MANGTAHRTYEQIGEDIAALAGEEAWLSRLPGNHNGPADAYRHLLWSAELTRRTGSAVAAALVTGHEVRGKWRSIRERDRPILSFDEESMDTHNNLLGVAIGAKAVTWEGVKARVRLIIETSGRDGADRKGARWLDKKKWHDPPPRRPAAWPDIDWNDAARRTRAYDAGGAEHGYDARKRGWGLMESEGWMQRSRVNPNHFVIDLKKKAEIDRARAAGGTVHVDGYTQMRAGKTVAVSDHERGAPSH